MMTYLQPIDPPTHPCFISMKNRKERAFERGRSNFEKNCEKDNSLSLTHTYAFNKRLPYKGTKIKTNINQDKIIRIYNIIFNNINFIFLYAYTTFHVKYQVWEMVWPTQVLKCLIIVKFLSIWFYIIAMCIYNQSPQ